MLFLWPTVSNRDYIDNFPTGCIVVEDEVKLWTIYRYTIISASYIGIANNYSSEKTIHCFDVHQFQIFSPINHCDIQLRICKWTTFPLLSFITLHMPWIIVAAAFSAISTGTHHTQLLVKLIICADCTHTATKTNTVCEALLVSISRQLLSYSWSINS